MSESAAQLARLAQEELELVATRRFGELADLHARRADALAALPAVVDAEDRPVLERALAVQQAVAGLLERVHGEIAGELARLQHGRRAAAGYGATATRPVALKPT